jgi:hypothetical protein
VTLEIHKIVHQNVNPDGTFLNARGAVMTEGGILMSAGEGCSLPDCHCSDGYWITIMLPRTKDGIVEGVTVKFSSKREFEKFMRTRRLYL